MNITLTGNLGSGKSSICRIFKKEGFEIISGGDLFRQVAAEKGVSVLELNEMAKADRSIDDRIDQRSTELGDMMDHTVFDSRLAWHFVRESFKVFLLVDTDEAARRVFAGDARANEAYSCLAEATEGLAARAVLETERFKTLYQIDYYDMRNYDLVIESTNAAPEEIAAVVLEYFKRYKEAPFEETKVVLNLRNMYPAKKPVVCPEKIHSESLIAASPVSLVSCCGYNYVVEAQDTFLQELVSGKAFAEVCSFTIGDAAADTEEAEFRAVEETAGFQYRSYPNGELKKHEYMMNLTK